MTKTLKEFVETLEKTPLNPTETVEVSYFTFKRTLKYLKQYANIPPVERSKILFDQLSKPDQMEFLERLRKEL